MPLGRRTVAVIAALGAILVPSTVQAAESPEFFKLGAGTRALDLATGPDGNVWFGGVSDHVYSAQSVVGRVSPTGDVSEFPFDEPGPAYLAAGVRGIAFGPDGGLWFTEGRGLKIGRL